MKYLRVAAFQGPAIQDNQDYAIGKTLQIMRQAHDTQVDIVCMPELYLHGYHEDENDARKYALNLDSYEFYQLCKLFEDLTPTLILGLNELSGGKIFNSVVVISKGKLLGVYRKSYKTNSCDFYSLGTDFPIFKLNGIPFGVLICCDINYLEPAKILSLNGARLIFCSMFNRLQRPDMLSRVLNRSPFITRAFENDCWLVASDVVMKKQDLICPGLATVVDNSGRVLASIQHFQENLITYSIPLENLQTTARRKLIGNPQLFKTMIKSYSTNQQKKDNNYFELLA